MGYASLSDQADIRFVVLRAGLRPLSYMNELKRHPAAVNLGARPSGRPRENVSQLCPAKRPVTSGKV